MERNRGIGSIAMMVVAIAAMTLVRAFRWNELGLLDHIMIVVLWIAVAGGATAIGGDVLAVCEPARQIEQGRAPAKSNVKRGCRSIEVSRRARMIRPQGRCPPGLEVCSSRE
jgi:hypothetical protein